MASASFFGGRRRRLYVAGIVSVALLLLLGGRDDDYGRRSAARQDQLLGFVSGSASSVSSSHQRRGGQEPELADAAQHQQQVSRRRDLLLQAPTAAAAACLLGSEVSVKAADAMGIGAALYPAAGCSGIFSTKCAKFYDPSKGLDPNGKQDLLKQMPKRAVLCVGEVHDNRVHHGAELQLLRALRKQSLRKDAAPLTIGMEMFHSTAEHKEALADYVFGDDSLPDLLRRTSWRTTWGWPIENYAPILEFAKAKKIPVVGLNVPERVSVFVRENGIQGLVGRPGFPEMDFSDSKHLSLFVSQFVGGRHGQMDLPYTVLPEDLRKRYEEQVLREEWIARSATKIAKNSDGRVLAVLGRNHIEGRAGVPDRIEKRLKGEDWARPFTVLLQPRPGDQGYVHEHIPNTAVADWVWYLG